MTQGFLIPLTKSLFYLFRKVSTLVQGSKIVKRKVSDVKNMATAIVHFFVLIHMRHNELKRVKKSNLAGQCTVCLNG